MIKYIYAADDKDISESKGEQMFFLLCSAIRFTNGFFVKEEIMESRIAILGIFINELDSASKINDLLHEYSQYIIGRMGIPYKDKQVSVMSVIIDGPNDVIGALSGKIGMIKGVNVKALYSKV